MKTSTLKQYIHISNHLEISLDNVWIFRRKAMTLHNWFEKECGDSNNFASWCIERDPQTDKPFLVTYPNSGKTHQHAIPDMEKGARKAIAKLCTELGLFFFIQTDCRGLSLYLSREEMTDTDYNSKGFGVGF